MNILLQTVNFLLAWTASWKIGIQFSMYLRLPMIMGYMAAGVTMGRFVTDMLKSGHGETVDMNTTSIGVLVMNTTLAFIAFCAGSEINLPELGRKTLLEIFRYVLCNGVLMTVVGTSIVMLSFSPELKLPQPRSLVGETYECRWAASWLIAVILWAGSVIEVLAIYHETSARGPVTKMMVSTTMLLDMTVVMFFAVAQSVVSMSCPVDDAARIVAGWSLLSVFLSILAWLAGGLLLGAMLELLLHVPVDSQSGRNHTLALMVKTLLIMTLGGTAYFTIVKVLNVSLLDWFPEYLTIRMDPLLVCMIASSIISHFSTKRQELQSCLQTMAPIVMPMFFTIIGATINVQSVGKHVFGMAVLFVLRFLSVTLGSLLASSCSGHSAVVRSHLWMTLHCQSGVTLGLVAQLQMADLGKQKWSEDVAAMITGCVVMNQLVGPSLCRMGIRRAGEAHDKFVPTTVDAAVGTPLSLPSSESSVSPYSRSTQREAMLRSWKDEVALAGLATNSSLGDQERAALLGADDSIRRVLSFQLPVASRYVPTRAASLSLPTSLSAPNPGDGIKLPVIPSRRASGTSQG